VYPAGETSACVAPTRFGVLADDDRVFRDDLNRAVVFDVDDVAVHRLPVGEVAVSAARRGRARTARTFPVTGAIRSLTLLTDSMSPQASGQIGVSGRGQGHGDDIAEGAGQSR
jgi:hypothetical protein